MTDTKTELKRRAFLKKGLAGLAVVGAVPGAVKAAAIGAGREARTAAAQAGAKPIIRTLGRTGLSPELARAVLLGLARFPALIGEHAEQIAALDLSEADAARLRDVMVEAALT
ncbi:MAG: hypothetical protein ACXW2O_02300, partial [Candidatus Aminicenantales bacterium]